MGKQIELCEKCNGPVRHCECDGKPHSLPRTGSALMTAMTEAFGLGPRRCHGCGTTFAVPAYLECKDWTLCETCALERFYAWLRTDEGHSHIIRARLLAAPNKGCHSSSDASAQAWWDKEKSAGSDVER